MKKIVVFLMCALLCFTLFAIAGCGEQNQGADAIADMKIGSELPVYPNSAFDYKCVAEDGSEYLIRISKISVTLIDKIDASSSDPITGMFYPYKYSVAVSGTTSPEHAGRKFYIYFSFASGTTYSNDTPECAVNADGTLSWNMIWNGTELSTVYFRNILTSDY